MNRRFLLLAAATSVSALVACTVSQDLGGGSGNVGGQSGDSGTGPTTDSGQGSSGAIDSGTSGTIDSGTSSGNVDAGKDASVVYPPCPAVAGYPAAPYMKFTFTGGTFAGSWNTDLPAGAPEKSVIMAGHYTGTGPDQTDYVNHFLVNAYLPNHVENGQFVGPEWKLAILTEETGVALPIGTALPITVRPRIPHNGGGLGDDPGSNQSVADDKLGRYPGTGPGSCTMIVDFQQVGKVGVRACLNARFTCTGLVGKTTGQAIDLVNGQLSYAGGPN